MLIKWMSRRDMTVHEVAVSKKNGEYASKAQYICTNRQAFIYT